MSSSPLAETIEQLCREKNIDHSIVISAVEDAVATAARKHFKTKEDLHVIYNEETQQLELYALKQVTDEVHSPETEISLDEARAIFGEDVEVEVGDMLQFPRPMEEMGRIAAQTAKQIIFQKVREAERNNIYNEYISRIGEMVNGFVKRFERGNMIVDLGKIESILPRSQQSPVEPFNQGDRIRVVINNVSKEAKGPQVEVSRTSPELIKRLFETEVPEIYDGTVVIKAAVREPGDRAKVAVYSNDPDVDPVGACVGMKGSRVQAVIRELRGEKIDIIPWSEDPVVFAANALSPAKVSKVQIIDFQRQHLEVIVEDSQLSLAIGKKGQNVRLAAKLVDWHIDIRSEGEMKRQVASQMEALLSAPTVPLAAVGEMNSSYLKKLAEAGIETVEQLAECSVDDVAHILDVSLDEAQTLAEQAYQIMQIKSERMSEREASAASAGEADQPETWSDSDGEPSDEASPEFDERLHQAAASTSEPEEEAESATQD
ncbi:MAG TPA: transcription termination factor NusA [Acidobacteriota bacterium]|nr:transcription termination factor NusA [Acidobacteriota bacterium]HNB70544.1 transcription termination factor NusA [Acidobacteriota bacterium]HNC43486.1 transcription termination factor NusA [Acidobacteriota bacterium]HNG91201.1 transcription termination factor NusA [Acidobacteriota bacterium]HNH80833.1 transcription termination factor NusA [Acidobacteriota bacterium]